MRLRFPAAKTISSSRSTPSWPAFIFCPTILPDTIARKALRVNLSDLAAKGAIPAGFVLTLALPEIDENFLAPFATALGEDAALFKCPLLGGDTVKTPGPLSISVTAFGRVPPGQMVHRFGAQPGDVVVVTGTIGDAALGLRLLQDKSGDGPARCRGHLRADRSLSCAGAAHGAGDGAARACAVRRWICRTALSAILENSARRRR